MESLDPDILHFILRVGLPREELLKRLQGFGCSIPGVRLSQLNRSELADGLVEAHSRAPSVAADIDRMLDDQLPRPALVLPPVHSLQEIKAFKKSLLNLRPEEMAAHLWWLSKAEGPGKARALRTAIGVLESRLEDVDQLASRDTLKAIAQRALQASDLEKSLEESRRSEHHLKKKAEDLSSELEGQRKKAQYQEKELTAARQTIKDLQIQMASKTRVEEDAQEAERRSNELAQAGARITELQHELFAARQKLARLGELKRAGVFVDVQNLLITAQELYGSALDFRALRTKIEEGPDHAGIVLTEAHAYLAEDPLQEERRLKSQLTEAGYIVHTRPIIYRADGTAKGDWDLGMTIAVLDRADRLDVIVLGTGDGDFLDLVRYLKEKKPHLQVEIVCFDSPRHTSAPLLQSADRVHRLGPRDLLAAKSLI